MIALFQCYSDFLCVLFIVVILCEKKEIKERRSIGKTKPITETRKHEKQKCEENGKIELFEMKSHHKDSNSAPLSLKAAVFPTALLHNWTLAIGFDFTLHKAIQTSYDIQIFLWRHLYRGPTSYNSIAPIQTS